MLKDLPRYECLLDAAKQFPDMDPTACEAFLHLLRTADLAFKSLSQHFSDHNLSQGRFTVLMLLVDKMTGSAQTLTPAELAECAGVTRATITGLVDTLERDGLVSRLPDPNDRRMMSVSLTEKGMHFVDGMLPAHFRLISGLMSELDADECKVLVRLLDKVVSAQASFGPGAPAAHS